jgi:hypothetical protein
MRSALHFTGWGPIAAGPGDSHGLMMLCEFLPGVLARVPRLKSFVL